jgi:hypothetical protein
MSSLMFTADPDSLNSELDICCKNLLSYCSHSMCITFSWNARLLEAIKLVLDKQKWDFDTPYTLHIIGECSLS